jgi:hypothetical protein
MQANSAIMLNEIDESDPQPEKHDKQSFERDTELCDSNCAQNTLSSHQSTKSTC